MTESNIILVGRKPVMNYVLACITLITGGAPKVGIKVRGQAISRAVDAVEIVRHRFVPDIKVEEVKIGTEQIASEEESPPKNVSTIEITLMK